MEKNMETTFLLQLRFKPPPPRVNYPQNVCIYIYMFIPVAVVLYHKGIREIRRCAVSTPPGGSDYGFEKTI